MKAQAIAERHETKSRTVPEQSRTVVKTRLPKDHQDYWKSKLRKRTYRTAAGKLAEIPEWQVRMTWRGRESWFNTHTANKVDAAIKARDIYRMLVSPGGGWDATLERYKPEMAKRKTDCTVGEFLDEIEQKSGLKATTFHIYARKFRSLVADIAEIPDAGKHDYATKGYDQWLKKVHSVKLSRITPERVQAWNVEYVKREDPLQQKRAKVSANSILRSSKSLFSPKILKHVAKSIELPSELPFNGIEFWKVGKTRYKSEINPKLLMVAACRELLAPHPEVFKIFLLALGAGLRRDEIDTMQWTQLNPERRSIRVETNVYTEAKSSESEAEVFIDSKMMKLLFEFKEGCKSPFVVNSEVAPRHSTTYHHYRCQRHFDHLVAWLRSKGVTARNAIHALRKEFGSLVCAQGGIYQASEQLRHSDIRVTRDSYLDRKDRVVVKLTLPTAVPRLSTKPSRAVPKRGRPMVNEKVA